MTELNTSYSVEQTVKFDEPTEEVKARLLQRLPLLFGIYKGAKGLAGQMKVLENPDNLIIPASKAIFDDKGRIESLFFFGHSSPESYTFTYTPEDKVASLAIRNESSVVIEQYSYGPSQRSIPNTELVFGIDPLPELISIQTFSVSTLEPLTSEHTYDIRPLVQNFTL